MEVIQLLLVIFLLQGGRCNGKDGPYCMEQRGTIIVEEKGSVTIPCNFTYPKPKYKSADVRVSWIQSRGERCGGGETIYIQTGGGTHENYRGRISPGGNPNRGTATITINDLRRTDNSNFCCRIEIYEDNTYKDGFQNSHGTNIRFKDEFSVEQTDVVPAMLGEDITIPCLVHYKDPSVIDLVSWHVGSSDVCADNKEKTIIWNQPVTGDPGERWSVVDFPRDLSLRIKGVTSEDIKQYCCRVTKKLRKDNIVSSTHGTEVVLVDNSRKPEFEVLQPETTSFDVDGSATISCLYKYQSDTNLLWTGVFWRVGSPRGAYAYHPFPAMVHPTYRGRTELRGLADLHMKGVKDTDNTTYYCFVMLKTCVGKEKVSSTIHYGRGTKLDVRGTSNNDSHSEDKLTSSYPLVYGLVAGLLVIIILCVVIFIILKKKGIISKTRSGREDAKYLTSNVALKDQNTYGNVQEPEVTSSVAQEDSGEVLYAHLNESSLQQKTSNGSKGRKPDNDSQVVYAAVKPTNAPQDIYATVQERR